MIEYYTVAAATQVSCNRMQTRSSVSIKFSFYFLYSQKMFCVIFAGVDYRFKQKNRLFVNLYFFYIYEINVVLKLNWYVE